MHDSSIGGSSDVLALVRVIVNDSPTTATSDETWRRARAGKKVKSWTFLPWRRGLRLQKVRNCSGVRRGTRQSHVERLLRSFSCYLVIDDLGDDVGVDAARSASSVLRLKRAWLQRSCIQGLILLIQQPEDLRFHLLITDLPYRAASRAAWILLFWQANS